MTAATPAPNLAQLRRRLASLPDLARRAADDGDYLPGAGWGGGVRVAPGSKPPPGVNLGGIGDGITPHAHLLGKISDCVRVAVEETSLTEPSRDAITWRGETSWLLATMDTWAADQWTLEWITRDVRDVHRALRRIVEKLSGGQACDWCGTRLATYETETLTIVECRECERVVGMRERRFLTTAEAAAELGITPEGVRKRIQRGQLQRTPDGAVVADGLDWARRKLGIPIPGEDVC